MTLKTIVYFLKKILFRNGKLSFSQGGEDLILNTIFLSKSTGFYIDVGANHPTKHSNTYLFYRMGWNGINIDALPDAINLFQKQRKRDINIHTGVGDSEGILKFYTFKESSYNTFDENRIDKIEKVSELLDVQEIRVQTLCSILNQQKVTTIDFMSIDVEGLDLNVLKSNDWGCFRPKVIVVEEAKHGNDIRKSEIFKFLLANSYVYLCSSVTNAFYLEKDFFYERFVMNYAN